MTSKKFALIAAGGYIAPRHFQAIRDTSNELAVAYDVSDSVGIMDSYFPDAAFFTDFENFSAFVDQRSGSDEAIDYVSICSPNDLHRPHIQFALRAGADAICEKPLVVDEGDLEILAALERQTGQRVNTILQLRLHDSVVALKRRVGEQIAADPTTRFDVDLTYITSRGAWYHASWKGEDRRSGGIATNIGIHFFDMLAFLFGDIRESRVHLRTAAAASGVLSFAHADVRWFLSIDAAFLPADAVAAGKRTYRSITMGGQEIEFSEGFTELHTRSYRDILAGTGFGLDVAAPSVRLAHQIRTAPLVKLAGDFHPMAASAAAAA